MRSGGFFCRRQTRTNEGAVNGGRKFPRHERAVLSQSAGRCLMVEFHEEEKRSTLNGRSRHQNKEKEKVGSKARRAIRATRGCEPREPHSCAHANEAAPHRGYRRRCYGRRA